MADPTKHSPPLDVRSNLLNPLVPDLTTIIDISSTVPSNTVPPVATNTSVDPTEAFKLIFNDIIEAIPLLIETISYEPETLPLQLEKFNHKLNYAATNYKDAVPHPSK